MGEAEVFIWPSLNQAKKNSPLPRSFISVIYSRRCFLQYKQEARNAGEERRVGGGRRSESTALKSGPAEGRKWDLSRVPPALRVWATSGHCTRPSGGSLPGVSLKGVFGEEGQLLRVVIPNSLPLAGN
jgi:hypothetical protein